MADSVRNLDFSKATEQLRSVAKTAKEVDFGALAGGAKDFGKELGGNLLNGLKGIGRALLANPLFALGAVLAGAVVAAVKLRDSLPPVRAVFDAVGKAVGFVTDGIKAFTDAIGLSSFAAQEAADRTRKAYEESSEALRKAQESDARLLKARGATERELAELAVEQAKARMEAAKAAAEATKAEFEELQKREKDGLEITEDQKKALEEGIKIREELAKANEDVTVSQQELNRVVKEGTEAELSAQEQLAVLQAKTPGERQKAQIEAIRAQAKRDQEAARLAGKSEAEITLIAEKAEQQVADIRNAAGEKALAERKKREDALLQVQEEFLLRESEVVRNGFDRRLKQLADLGLKETEEYRAVVEAKDRAVEAAELASVQRREQRLAELSAQAVENARARLESELAAEVQAAGDNVQARVAAERRFSQELLRVREEEAQSRLRAQLAAVDAEETQALAKVREGSEEELLLRREYSQRRVELTQATADAVSKIVSDSAAKEKQNVKDLADTLGDEIRKVRDTIDEGEPVSIFNLRDRKADIKRAGDEELALIEDYYRKGIISKEQYDQAILDSQQRTDAALVDSANRALEAVRIGIEIAQASVAIASQISTSALDSKRAELEQEGQLLDEQYERRRAAIEANVKDERARAEALAALDQEFGASREALDKRAVELQKRQIKRDRDAALAQILLSQAQAVAGVVGQAAKTPTLVSFYIGLAGALATVYSTIRKAKDALKQAGGGGGGGAADAGGGIGGGIGTGPQQASATPQFQSTPRPEGTGGQSGQGSAQNAPVFNPTVAVTEIQRVTDRVNVQETLSTVG